MSVSNKPTLNVRCPRCRAIAIRIFSESSGKLVARLTCGHCGYKFNVALIFKQQDNQQLRSRATPNR